MDSPLLILRSFLGSPAHSSAGDISACLYPSARPAISHLRPRAHEGLTQTFHFAAALPDSPVQPSPTQPYVEEVEVLKGKNSSPLFWAPLMVLLGWARNQFAPPPPTFPTCVRPQMHLQTFSTVLKWPQLGENFSSLMAPPLPSHTWPRSPIDCGGRWLRG